MVTRRRKKQEKERRILVSGPKTKPTSTIHYPRERLAKYGKHFMDCYRQTKTWCRTKKKKGETVSECAEGICHHHMHSGRCFIGGHLKQGSISGNRRAKPTKAYLKRLAKRKS